MIKENEYAMRYIRLLLEYDGTDYHGWQMQKTDRTIQSTIEAAILEITGEASRLAAAGRTDAGVHALGQVAVFATRSTLAAETFMRALNAGLPGDLRILSSSETDASFNPRYDALRKSYFYLISKSKQQSAFFNRYVWDLKIDLGLQNMKDAAGVFIGEHDFTSFRGAGCGAKTPFRNIYSIDISAFDEISFMTATIKGGFIKIRIEANAFLRHMVRNIVGTLAEVGRGRMSAESIRNIIEVRDRKKAGPTAPAKGLFLENIIY